MDSNRPKFLSSYFKLLSKEAERSGWLSIIPYALVASSVLGAIAAYFIPQSFWADDQWQVSIAVYGAFLTFNGLLLALGWNAFSRMYEILFRGDFGAYLGKNNLLNDYLTHITYINVVQVIAVILSTAGMVLCLFEDVSPIYDRIALGASVAVMVYALKQTLDSLTAMNDLAWQSAYFEINRPRDANGNVIPFTGNSNQR
jgi:hypothetical protein